MESITEDAVTTTLQLPTLVPVVDSRDVDTTVVDSRVVDTTIVDKTPLVIVDDKTKTIIAQTQPVNDLFTQIVLNTQLLKTVHNLKADSGFTNADVPELILCIMSIYNTSTVRAYKALTTEDLQALLERVYNYLVDKYDLVAPADRLAMYAFFDMSLKLCLASPNVRDKLNSCWNFLCGKR